MADSSLSQTLALDHKSVLVSAKLSLSTRRGYVRSAEQLIRVNPLPPGTSPERL
ncbi:hypothetical protein PILCRDRAFT_812320 [Piloderma croceum F 1598]|uniref:Uncharacterized protein n=1 Tax=Piloderma croceum (strain F 1598) TaxID=765440 RepID=A0A0C3G2I4_PILCF|nr:hypothetical protein PILCRDRAFT_812320 [Piloderma croceum F 1598]